MIVEEVLMPKYCKKDIKILIDKIIKILIDKIIKIRKIKLLKLER